MRVQEKVERGVKPNFDVDHDAFPVGGATEASTGVRPCTSCNVRFAETLILASPGIAML